VALNKYETFLENVKASSDEFSEVPDIIFRYKTLCKENEKLDSTHRKLEDKLKNLKDNTTKYIKDKSTEIIKLNNDISSKKTEMERIIDE